MLMRMFSNSKTFTEVVNEWFFKQSILSRIKSTGHVLQSQLNRRGVYQFTHHLNNSLLNSSWIRQIGATEVVFVELMVRHSLIRKYMRMIVGTCWVYLLDREVSAIIANILSYFDIQKVHPGAGIELATACILEWCYCQKVWSSSDANN